MNEKIKKWQPKDLNDKIKFKILGNAFYPYPTYFDKNQYVVECKATVPKDHRIDFLQAIKDNFRVNGQARLDLEKKYGPDIVMACAFPDTGNCLITLNGIGAMSEDFHWSLTGTGQAMLKDYHDRLYEAHKANTPDIKCPICEMLKGNK